ncbi:hypothetical protein LCGC14_1850010, partial [marine sediment metagenome]
MKLRIATVRIKSLTPYSQSKALQSEKPKEESYDDFNKRIWPERMHVNDAGDVFIPAAGISQGLAAAAAALFEGRPWAITPTARSPESAVRTIENLVKLVGGNVV